MAQSAYEVELDIAEAFSTTDTLASTEQYPSGLRFCSIMISLLSVIVLGGMDFSIIGVAVPVMTQEYGTSVDIAWYNVAYRLTACATQLAWGRILTFLCRGSVVSWTLSCFSTESSEEKFALVDIRALNSIGSVHSGRSSEYMNWMS